MGLLIGLFLTELRLDFLICIMNGKLKKIEHVAGYIKYAFFSYLY